MESLDDSRAGVVESHTRGMRVICDISLGQHLGHLIIRYDHTRVYDIHEERIIIIREQLLGTTDWASKSVTYIYIIIWM